MLASASFLACHIPSRAKLFRQHIHHIPCWCFLALVLDFELVLDCDSRICSQKPFHNLSFLLCLSGGGILNKVTAASVAKYGKNTNV
jgi:hypothetical protein